MVLFKITFYLLQDGCIQIDGTTNRECSCFGILPMVLYMCFFVDFMLVAANSPGISCSP